MGMFWGLLIVIFLSPLLGWFFVRKREVGQKFLSFFLGLAMGTLGFLFLTENIQELFPWSENSWWAILFLLIGLGINFFLDRSLPESEHHHHHHCHHEGKMCHLATMTTISLAVHNIIEGAAFGILAATDMTAVSVLAAMIVLHNIPLNLALWIPESYIHSQKKHIYKHLFWANFPFVIGAMSYYATIAENLPESAMIMAEFLVFGMIIYLLIHEIWPIAWQGKGKKNTIWGILGGGILVAIINFFS